MIIIDIIIVLLLNLFFPDEKNKKQGNGEGDFIFFNEVRNSFENHQEFMADNPDW